MPEQKRPKRRAPRSRVPVPEPAPNSSRSIAGRGSQNLQELGRVLDNTLDTIEKVFGSDHPNFARALENHAASLRRMADSAQVRADHIRNALLLRRGFWPAESRAPLLDLRPKPGPFAPDPATPSSPAPPALLGVREAADYLTISADTLYGLVHGDEIPHIRVGRSIRFRLSDLEKYVEERTSQTWTRVDRRGRPRKR